MALHAQRTSIEQERVAFEEERKLWAQERVFLRTRIAELEFELGRGPADLPHADSPIIPPLVVNRGAGPSTTASATASASAAAAAGTAAEQQTQDSSDDGHVPVWQGLSPLRRPTRTFQHTDTYEKLDSTPISLNAALSPRSAHLRVPVELVDSSLDGIMLKSTALPADLVARVTSPSGSDSSPQLPPQGDKDKRSQHSSPSNNSSASPDKQPQEQQRREDGDCSSYRSDDEITKELENLLNIPPGTQPLPPTPPIPKDDHTIQEELEADLADVPEDPCLKGPLNLRNDITHDQAFLSVLDRKLLNEAHKILAAPPLSDAGSSDDEEPSDGAKTSDGHETGRPLTGDSASEKLEIKFKPSTNFGTAFGSIGT
ncbi:hypothetical protein AAP_05025 [Ascosphaera apis ARSEF 7405]|uniref:Uncharacterized protein n=1 Tax=Ascosphaera apis ARSEF 7405 TaxID=392613 RepID=A0A162I4D5_9EURO|nr:hypothetical protein AAP_05025 [Ascosphaera apis ARSEF 7405]